MNLKLKIIDKESQLELLKISLKEGRYKPYFTDEEKEVFDIEAYRYPTTQKIQKEIMKNNPSKFNGDNKPVEQVSWWDALEYFRILWKIKWKIWFRTNLWFK